MKRYIIIISAVFLGATMVGAIFFWKAKPQTPSQDFLSSATENAIPIVAGEEVKLTAVVYKSPTCGCCGEYISYLKKQGFEVKVENRTDINPIKSEYGIPENMQSCHTTVMGDYVIEGHVPIEAIRKLLKEKPDIDGVALPGMPAGSPGMPGTKDGNFEVYGLENGKSQEFMRL